MLSAISDYPTESTKLQRMKLKIFKEVIQFLRVIVLLKPDFSRSCNMHVTCRSRALGFKQAMPIQVPKSPVPLFPEKSSRMYKQHNDI